MATFKNRHGAYVKRGGATNVSASQPQWDALVETTRSLIADLSSLEGLIHP